MTGVLLGGGLAGLALGMLGAGGTIIGLPMFLYLGGPQGHAAFGHQTAGRHGYRAAPAVLAHSRP